MIHRNTGSAARHLGLLVRVRAHDRTADGESDSCPALASTRSQRAGPGRGDGSGRLGRCTRQPILGTPQCRAGTEGRTPGLPLGRDGRFAVVCRGRSDRVDHHPRRPLLFVLVLLSRGLLFGLAWAATPVTAQSYITSGEGERVRGMSMMGAARAWVSRSDPLRADCRVPRGCSFRCMQRR